MSTSTIGDYIKNHAYVNVWCTPDQDKSAIFKPTKLSQVNGSRNKIKIAWDIVRLPNAGRAYHVYQIGQVSPKLLGFPALNTWMSGTSIANANNLIADCYTQKGLMIPKYQSWFMMTRDRNFIVAIEDQKDINIDLNTSDLFIHLYRNSFYESDRANLASDKITSFGTTVTNTQQILDIQVQVSQLEQISGKSFQYVNGVFVDKIDLINCKLNDKIEFIHDASIKQEFEINISDLRYFDSVLDNVRKYLIRNPNNTEIIEYHDDVDFYIVKKSSATRFNGVYYHRNSELSVRMVTHKDYSIPVAFVADYRNNLPGWINEEQLTIKVYVRKSGYERPLVDEESRIKDLYKMSDSDVLDAMVGLDSVVDVWKAENLENSEYVKMMSVNYGDITRKSAQEAYGYNATSKLLGNSPVKVILQDGVKFVNVPIGLVGRCTAYEYDQDGYLVHWQNAGSGSLYYPFNPTCDLVEFVAGEHSDELDVQEDLQTGTIDPNYNYRFYIADRNLGNLAVWEDVTNTSLYAINTNNNTYAWSVNLGIKKVLVISNKKHLTYNYDYDLDNGIINVAIRRKIDVNNYRVLDFPLGDLDLFVNGKSLILGLDYHVKFPTIVIVNKEFLENVHNQNQTITIRHSGFCPEDLTLEKPTDIGFVKYGVLSRNARYNLRENKVNRIVVKGSVYHISELEFSEENFTVSPSDAKNGSPYSIRNVFIPMNAYLERDSGQYVDPTFQLRERSLEIDESISNYLTIKLPETGIPQPNAIPSKYKVVSPFISRIINDLQEGIIDDVRLTRHYGNSLVQELCEPYEQWLDYDPIKPENRPDLDFVDIHPHYYNTYIDLNPYHYKFITRVIELYCPSIINISSTIRIDSV